MSDNLKLGHLIEGEQHRDATHIAVAPVVAGAPLKPGTHVGFVSPGTVCEAKMFASDIRPVGVVDPFLRKDVRAGEKFWLFLYPGTITGLRHEWSHPAFLDAAHTVEDSRKAAARQWMQEWCDRHKYEAYDESLTVERAIYFGEEMTVNECENARDDIDADWWNNWEILTGKSSAGKREEYFRCAC